jgi:hypothetical protein
MRVRSAVPPFAALAVALALAGCTSKQPPLPRDCLSAASMVADALRRAPAPVTLAGGTRLSTCVARSDDSSELQDVGSSYTGAATTLSERVARSDAAALQLGYLVGATRRGVARTSGLAAELVRRLDQQVGVDGPPAARRAAYARGLSAGAREG